MPDAEDAPTFWENIKNGRYSISEVSTDRWDPVDYYDPDPKAPLGFHLPMDLTTGEVDEKAWKRWLRHDPIHLVEKKAVQENLRSMKGVFIDCGFKDQYHLQYGSRILRRKLKDLKIPHHYEEFDDNHSSIDYRMDVSLPWLYRALR